MSTLRITKHGETVLKKVSGPVDCENMKKDIPRLLRDMWKTMYSVKGVGLAAPQIGLNIRLAIIDVRPQGKSQRLVLINPRIVSKEGIQRGEEGCLSVPGVYAKITRASRVAIRAFDAHGKPYEMTAEGLLARAFQHEIDHLDGKLFIDHLDFIDKLKVMSLIRDLKKNWN
ncbi:MAG: peptide deformylase [Elusimicrobia bacterium RIFCSPHIGHO2_02_FULL_57_9]|nr:MAG: peptide deformylase [Elusimicrobia bacterium RIFCSPHIGHO2_02_FULL_57_9]